MRVRSTSELVPASAAWLGFVPRHWKQKKLKYAVRSCDLRVEGEDAQAPYVGLEHIESWTGRLSVPQDSASTGIVNSYACGDVLLGKLRPYLAKVHVAETDGICTTEALVLRSLGELEPRYLFYYLATPPAIENINSSTYGAKMPRANWEFVGEQCQLIPPQSEQVSIINFLDRETARIDALIAKKRRLLELLEEKRLAVITHAVTKGLDPNAPMKDSGIDWLGQIPAHWEVKRLRFVMDTIEQGWSPLCSNYPAEDDEWGVLKVGCVNGTTFDPSENKALPSDLAPREHYEISSGDILMSRANTKELLGSAAIVQDVRPRLLLCDKLYRLIVSGHIDRQFAVRTLRSHIARFQYERAATGASGSMQNIGQDTIKDVIVPLPPLEEQRAIVARLSTEAARIDRMLDANRRFIEVLQEYRSALITNAVTGKIDVRGKVTKEAAA